MAKRTIRPVADCPHFFSLADNSRSSNDTRQWGHQSATQSVTKRPKQPVTIPTKITQAFPIQVFQRRHQYGLVLRAQGVAPRGLTETTTLLDQPPQQMPRVSVEDIAAYFRFELGETFGESGEQRTRCPVTSCDGNDDYRSVSINLDDPKGRWKCHRSGYGCGAQGDKLTLAHCMKHGAMPSGGKLTGKEFRETARNLQDISSGVALRAEAAPKAAPLPPAELTIDETPNTPLSESANENAQKLVTLESKNGWIDFLTISRFSRVSYDLPMASWKKRVPEIPVYGSIAGADAKTKQPLTPKDYRRAARHIWDEKGDGIYLFNFLLTRPASEPLFEVLEQLGDPHVAE